MSAQYSQSITNLLTYLLVLLAVARLNSSIFETTTAVTANLPDHSVCMQCTLTAVYVLSHVLDRYVCTVHSLLTKLLLHS